MVGAGERSHQYRTVGPFLMAAFVSGWIGLGEALSAPSLRGKPA